MVKLKYIAFSKQSQIHPTPEARWLSLAEFRKSFSINQFIRKYYDRQNQTP